MERVYKVSQINTYVRSVIERDGILSHLTVEGEVSNCKYHPSGHVYFSLKERDSQLNCVMFASAKVRGLPFAMRDGMLVQVSGRISVYERDGRYQLYAVKIERAGLGALYEELERRRKALAEEGIFDPDHKKQLPPYARRIGIVTAASGAALQDILQILRRRNPYLQPVLSPCYVQGEGAAETIVRAIRRVAKANVDVIIVGRGGGSIEDLWEFNDERVARAVYECEIPIVSAVGHEINTTLIDFAADMVAPTPSAAAELVSYEAAAVDAMLVDAHAALYRKMLEAIEASRQKLATLREKLRYASPQSRLVRNREQLREREERFSWLMRKAIADARIRSDRVSDQAGVLMRQRLQNERARLGILAARLDGLSPARALSKGYAYITVGGAAVSGTASIPPGTRIRGYVSDGGFEADVVSVCRNGDGENEG